MQSGLWDLVILMRFSVVSSISEGTAQRIADFSGSLKYFDNEYRLIPEGGAMTLVICNLVRIETSIIPMFTANAVAML